MENVIVCLLVFVLCSGMSGGQLEGLFPVSGQQIQTSCGPINPATANISCCMCENSRAAWYESQFGQSFNLDLEKNAWPFERNTASWNRICGWAYEIASCMKTKLPGCLADIGDEILQRPSQLYQYFISVFSSDGCGGDCGTPEQFAGSWTIVTSLYRQMCNKDQLKPSLTTLITDPEFDASTRCLDGPVRRNMYRCFISILQDLTQDLGTASVQTIVSIVSQLNRRGTDILKCVYGMINRSTCNAATRKVLYKVARFQFPAFIQIGDVDESTKEDFRSTLRCTVGVYGDPHLRTCWAKKLVTCSAKGQQTYVSNKYFVIEGTNVEVGPMISPRATSLKSISISFNNIDGDIVVASYTASGGDLPAVFDGTTSTSTGSGLDKVEIFAGGFGRIRFVQRGTGAVLVLRQWNGNYFFTLRMAQDVVVASTGLLIDGCPENQIITAAAFRPVRRKRAVTHAQCDTVCVTSAGSATSDFYESCYIDCMATGSTDFATQMTKGAIEDDKLVITFDSELIEEAYSAATVPFVGLWVGLFTLIQTVGVFLGTSQLV